MKIPYEKLSPEALRGVIEQFVSRDGPDSGHVETSFRQKIERIKRQLEKGDASIMFDEETKTCDILSKEELKRHSP